MRRLLVTGGCGFIGSNFIRDELAMYSDLSIHNLDKLTYAGNPENLADLADNPRYEFIHGDICDRTLVSSILSKHEFDAVVNFAAETHVDRSILDSAPFIQTNIVGTQVLVDCCRQHSIGRFLQVSTDEVYGSLGATGKFTETTPLAPNSPYSASKAAADLLIRASHETFGFPAIITRCSNNYGPYQFPEKLIPLFISNAIRNEQLPVYGSGQNVRDWIHVSDHCRGIDAALRRGRPGEVYNLGGNCEMTNLELTHLLLNALNKPRSLITHVADRPGHDRRYAIDSGKAQRELNWRPEVAFQDGLKETISWYAAHTDWVTRITSGDYKTYYAKQYDSRL